MDLYNFFIKYFIIFLLLQVQINYRGLCRIAIKDLVEEESSDGKLVVKIEKVKEDKYDPKDREISLYYRQIRQTTIEILKHRSETLTYVALQDLDPDRLCDVVADICSGEQGLAQQEILETIPIKERQKKVLHLLKWELDREALQKKVSQFEYSYYYFTIFIYLQRTNRNVYEKSTKTFFGSTSKNNQQTTW